MIFHISGMKCLFRQIPQRVPQGIFFENFYNLFRFFIKNYDKFTTFLLKINFTNKKATVKTVAIIVF